MRRNVILEPEAEAVSDAAVPPPRIYQLPPSKGREVLEKAQDSPVFMYPARINTMMADTGKWGRIPLYVVSPAGRSTPEDVIFYIHGAGWVFGSFHTHEKLVRELAARTGCIVVFPEYSRSPEVQYPTAMEQCYSVLCQLDDILWDMGCKMNYDTLTIAGDSVGGNMTIAMTLLAKYRKGPRIHKQLLYYPVTNACFNTESYCEFAEDYYLYRDGMIWFWNQYTRSKTDRNEITASPLRASIEQLRDLPEAMILNGQADVLRDEGEAFGEKLRLAGVPVTALRFQGMIHDFVMLNSLDQTRACRAAMDASTEWINRMNDKERYN
ncbi:MAG TPA: alpha/beta hydrolase [Candidatus Pelethocola excrementipullorum]|nr:alpha/beta hydrolase [Candidatus Pelethocola excrementipullorum]